MEPFASSHVYKTSGQSSCVWGLTGHWTANSKYLEIYESQYFDEWTATACTTVSSFQCLITSLVDGSSAEFKSQWRLHFDSLTLTFFPPQQFTLLHSDLRCLSHTTCQDPRHQQWDILFDPFSSARWCIMEPRLRTVTHASYRIRPSERRQFAGHKARRWQWCR